MIVDLMEIMANFDDEDFCLIYDAKETIEELSKYRVRFLFPPAPATGFAILTTEETPDSVMFAAERHKKGIEQFLIFEDKKAKKKR